MKRLALLFALVATPAFAQIELERRINEPIEFAQVAICDTEEQAWDMIDTMGGGLQQVALETPCTIVEGAMLILNNIVNRTFKEIDGHIVMFVIYTGVLPHAFPNIVERHVVYYYPMP